MKNIYDTETNRLKFELIELKNTLTNKDLIAQQNSLDGKQNISLVGFGPHCVLIESPKDMFKENQKFDLIIATINYQPRLEFSSSASIQTVRSEEDADTDTVELHFVQFNREEWDEVVKLISTRQQNTENLFYAIKG